MKFNRWSMRRIKLHMKTLTSRKQKHDNDPHIKKVLETPLPWWFIRNHLYIQEGADSPEELQRVINGIFRRKVEDDELFYVHIIDRNTVTKERIENA